MTEFTCEQLRATFPKMNEATVQLNACDGTEAKRRAALAGSLPVVSGGEYVSTPPAPPIAPETPRIRQGKPKKMNKTETDFFLHLQNLTSGKIRFTELRFELANNTHFKPDFTVDGRTVYEAKGPWASRDAFVRLKVAARLWPEFKWFLATRKKGGGWDIQEIYP